MNSKDNMFLPIVNMNEQEISNDMIETEVIGDSACP